MSLEKDTWLDLSTHASLTLTFDFNNCLSVRYLTQYLTLRGDDYKAHRLLAEVYKEHDEPGKALAAYKR